MTPSLHSESGSLSVRMKKLTAFLELEATIGACREFVLTGRRNFCQTGRRYADLESGGGHSPAAFFVSSGPAIPQRINSAGKRKGKS
jgi:hypothetical protein